MLSVQPVFQDIDQFYGEKTSSWWIPPSSFHPRLHSTWRFPKMRVPLNHQFLIGFSIKHHPFWAPPFIETPTLRNRPLMKPAKKTVAIATRLSNISTTWASQALLVIAGASAEWLRFRPWWRRSWETIVPMQTFSRKTSELFSCKKKCTICSSIKMVKMVTFVVKWSYETESHVMSTLD